jgi:hypothetical protein
MKSIISHNQGLFVAIVIVVGLMLWTFGCESKTRSPVTGKMVTRSELTVEVNAKAQDLDAELDTLQKQVELKVAELNRKDNIKQKLFDFVSVSATTGGLNYTGVVTLLGSLLGLGAVVDNRIKDKVIKNRPLPKV